MKELWQELFVEKTRVVLTMFAIAWGTLAILLMLSVGHGLLTRMTGLLGDLGSHLLVVMPGQTAQNAGGLGSGQTLQLNQKDIDALKKLDGVTQVLPEYSNGATVSWHQYSLSRVLSGVTGQYQQIRQIPITPGSRFINTLDNQKQRRVVVLGHEVVPLLFGKQLNPVGRTITIKGVPFTVVGMTAERKQLMQYETPDNYLIWIPASVYHFLFPTDSIRYLLVTYAQAQDRAQLKKSITAELAARHHFNPEDKSAVDFFDNQEAVNKTTDFFNGLQLFLGLVGVLTLLISGVGIANIMFVAVQRATPHIGIRMACGAMPGQIMLRYLLEALLVTALGAVLGLVITLLLMAGINPILSQVPILGLTGFTLSLSWSVFGVIAIVLFFVGCLSGIIPAWRAAKIQPVEALRHE